VQLYCMLLCGSNPDGTHYMEAHIPTPD